MTRDEIILKNIPLVKSIALGIIKTNPKHSIVNLDDLINSGVVGLIQSLDKYNGSVKFASFAAHRIRGEMLDSLRSIDPLSRKHRDSVNRIEKSKDKLRQELLREPSDEEVTISINLSLEEYYKYTSIETITISEEVEDTKSSVLDSMLDEEDNIGLRLAIKGLPSKWRTVVRLYYYEDWPCDKIAKKLKVSIDSVWQILWSARKRLKESYETKAFSAVA